MDGNKRIAETVQFFFGFAFGGFHHQGSGHGPAEGWRMKAIVHEAFGHVFGGCQFEASQIEDALVGHAPSLALEEYGKVGIEAVRDVVGI